jgi:hypothetical protein
VLFGNHQGHGRTGHSYLPHGFATAGYVTAIPIPTRGNKNAIQRKRPSLPHVQWFFQTTTTKKGKAVDPTFLPYFEGDYIPGEIENIIKKVKVGEHTKRKERVPENVELKLNKMAGNKNETMSNPGELARRVEAKTK